MHSVHKDKDRDQILGYSLSRDESMSVFKAHHMISGLTPLQLITL
jgi:hypothetical protein